MKVKQYPYLSDEAMELRRRDGVPPWGVHPCEVDALGEPPEPGTFREAWLAAAELRRAIEAED